MSTSSLGTFREQLFGLDASFLGGLVGLGLLVKLVLKFFDLRLSGGFLGAGCGLGLSVRDVDVTVAIAIG